ncbi:MULTISPECIES: Arc family DNA-binding protein [Comamonas]|uniref:Arc family DNA-binding protein n=1 Tax=Comamonas TaxID=283 RepID=UPI0001DA6998|nr:MULTISPECIES: Arc family DNA-binding protein [Comamonas]EFI62654.1 Arc domain-containing protein [Comamonas thiooxydans]TFF55633.1 Arc family DNA-binding protein [Comamonas sp. A23]
MATDTPTTGRDSDKFMLRLPDGMRDKLKAEAKSNNRTLNAEIVARLEGSFVSGASSDPNLHALALRIATLELELADSRMEAETLAIDSCIASGIALEAIKLINKHKIPHTFPEDDIAELEDVFEMSSERMDSVDKRQLDALTEQANAAIDRLVKLKATSLPDEPRRFRSKRPSSKKLADH